MSTTPESFDDMVRQAYGDSNGPGPSVSDSWSEETIAQMFRDIPRDSVPDGEYGRVKRICGDTVVKIVDSNPMPPPEALAHLWVSSRTSIPTPKIRRCFVHNRNGYLVMEYISGRQLKHTWDSLGKKGRAAVAATLCGYIDCLRSVSKEEPHDIPGPPGPTPQIITGPRWLSGFEKTKGPFNSYAELQSFCLSKLLPRYPNIEFDEAQSLVMTHGDLNMRNIVREDSGKLWVVDWELAGFYPPCFEYIGMLDDAEGQEAPETWIQLIAYMAGRT